jgi:hypothetical protein
MYDRGKSLPDKVKARKFGHQQKTIKRVVQFNDLG